jgi:Kdo2-lipid IVA lauroyltransferase/acyltransferase
VERLIARSLLAAVRLLACFPLEGQRWWGRFLGWCAWKLPTDAARITRLNLALCFPELSTTVREQLARESLQSTAALVAESGLTFHWPASRWQALVRNVRGREHVDAALAEGRGVLVLAPHLGNWEYLALYLGRFAALALYDPPRVAALEAAVRRARSRSGTTLLPIGVHGLRAVVQALRRGRVVALLPDQVPERRSGVHAPFFGTPALTMTLVGRLVQTAHPVVVLGTALRVDGGFDIEFEPVDPAVAHPDPSESAGAMNRSIEALVRRHPAQYQWEYKRFKRPPRGQPDVYRRGRHADRAQRRQ